MARFHNAPPNSKPPVPGTPAETSTKKDHRHEFLVLPTF